MQRVTQREARAWAEDDRDKALYCRKEKRFIEEHLICWIPIFCDNVTQEAELPFYGEMALLTKHFIEVEMEEINR